MRILASTVASFSLLLCGPTAFASADIIQARLAEAPTPPLRYVRFVGNTIRARHLNKHLDLKPGGPVNPALVKAGRKKLEEYYRSKGFDHVRVVIAKGAKDVEVVYAINEGIR